VMQVGNFVNVGGKVGLGCPPSAAWAA
jgi:hypothetical protein